MGDGEERSARSVLAEIVGIGGRGGYLVGSGLRRRAGNGVAVNGYGGEGIALGVVVVGGGHFGDWMVVRARWEVGYCK